MNDRNHCDKFLYLLDSLARRTIRWKLEVSPIEIDHWFEINLFLKYSDQKSSFNWLWKCKQF